MNMQQYRKTEQRGQIVRSGRFWCLRYWQRCTENGVTVRRRIRVRLGEVANTRSRKPHQEILDAAKNIMKGVNDSTIAPSMVVTVGDFAEHIYLKWADDYKRPSTAASYRETWTRHLKQHCASAWVANVETRDVQHWLNAIVEGAKHPLSVSTLGHCKFVLSGIFVLAAQQGYRSSEKGNPVTMARIPAQAVRARATHAYTAEEVSTMLAALAEKPVAATAIGIAAFAGLRIGEVEALCWEDYHDGCLFVSRSVWRGKISELKTEASAAPVAVVPQLAEILSMHHARSGFPATGPVFRNSLGGRLSMGNILCRLILPLCIAV